MVLVDMTAGTAQPVPTIIVITDLPDKPTLLKRGSINAETLAMYPHSSSSAMKKNNIIINGRNPITAPTPPAMPSTNKVLTIDGELLVSESTAPCRLSISPVSRSAISGPAQTCENWNTSHITAAKINNPAAGFISTLSTLSKIVILSSLLSIC